MKEKAGFWVGLYEYMYSPGQGLGHEDRGSKVPVAEVNMFIAQGIEELILIRFSRNLSNHMDRQARTRDTVNKCYQV